MLQSCQCGSVHVAVIQHIRYIHDYGKYDFDGRWQAHRS